MITAKSFKLHKHLPTSFSGLELLHAQDVLLELPELLNLLFVVRRLLSKAHLLLQGLPDKPRQTTTGTSNRASMR